jgi:hypothetical protein
MPYILRVHSHPLGVVVTNDDGGRELLIEGEKCCGITFEELARIAATTGCIKLDDDKWVCCRLVGL